MKPFNFVGVGFQAAESRDHGLTIGWLVTPHAEVILEAWRQKGRNGQSRGSWPDLQHTVGILGNTESTQKAIFERRRTIV